MCLNKDHTYISNYLLLRRSIKSWPASGRKATLTVVHQQTHQIRLERISATTTYQQRGIRASTPRHAYPRTHTHAARAPSWPQPFADASVRTYVLPHKPGACRYALWTIEMHLLLIYCFADGRAKDADRTYAVSSPTAREPILIKAALSTWKHTRAWQECERRIHARQAKVTGGGVGCVSCVGKAGK